MREIPRRRRQAHLQRATVAVLHDDPGVHFCRLFGAKGDAPHAAAGAAAAEGGAAQVAGQPAAGAGGRRAQRPRRRVAGAAAAASRAAAVGPLLCRRLLA